ncbi:uncharacterized protein At1g26090, chloroplastic [Telopea speciosissima]|uniref:uncharacterized protein At1g26090, chloroplastic n=1 Tax=Telopea speciosissima TaxID=54955 RepID=UPI001CC64B28|nr:uncharacterized protein At1g26090, chloroplastic [Telopea speciosissima]
MASTLTLCLTSSLLQRNPNRDFPIRTRKSGRRSYRPLFVAVQAEDRSPQKFTKLVTFLGKGGSGKTTSAVLAAQYFSKAGLSTCLVLHSQDPTAEYLMGCKIGASPTLCNNNLSVVRLETTKMLLEPLNQLKQADTRLNLMQGVLEGVVGEELGVLAGMDSIFAAFALEKFVGILKTVASRNKRQEKFDVVVYDGISTEETLRLIGSSERARWYLKYLRNVAENTDVGRLAAPSLLRLADETMRLNGRGLRLDGKTSAEIWDNADQILERASAAFAEPLKFGSYIVMDTNCPMSVRAALRYWGCAIQAGAHVAGAFGIARPQSSPASVDVVQDFSPLPFACMPSLSMGSVDWNSVLLGRLGEDAQNLLSAPASGCDRFQSPVKFDLVRKSISLFMPGFDKSEIKLYQYRGGSELLVEAGDQRRVIRLPSGIQGKVGGAKFTNKSLVITMR